MHSAADLLTRWPALDVAARRARLQETFHISPGPLSATLQAAVPRVELIAAGLWRHNPSVWSPDPGVQQTIANRLGWLTSPALMADALERLTGFAASIKNAGFTDVVLLGMGGSSLAPEVLRAILGVAPGWPRLHMLDSTDPAAVRAVSTNRARTLYLLASKSGSTIEPNSLAAYFRRELEDARVPRWADHFVAITDDGTALAERAHTEGFREVFINPSDIGGRYSALSYFGLVPAALMGQNVAAILGWGLAMLAATEPGFGSVASNPSIALGWTLGTAALAGRDKLTLLVPAAFEPFGLWVEQLVAESTGKQGKGIVPVAGEPLARAAAYGSDRLFVRLRVNGSFEEEIRDAEIRELGTAAPLAEVDLPEPSALGAEFVRWEVATAVAGALLNVNPFDEPNVQQAKDATRVLLDKYQAQNTLPIAPADRSLDGGIDLTLTTAARSGLGSHGPDAFLTLIGEHDYFGILAYIGPSHDLFEDLQKFRRAVRDRTKAATMFGYGPRYLHSTGQLHKGGPNTGVFLVLTATPREDLPIPGQPYSFGTLEMAQALGDFQSLDTAGRRALHVHLQAPDRSALGFVTTALLERLR